METQAILQDLNRSYELELRDVLTLEELEAMLAERVNTLIQRDFGALVQLLYRVDVSEAKLRNLLEANTGEDAAVLIAREMIERQWQKIETRRKYRQEPGDEEERW
jgi:hypothetical protein